MSDQINVLWVCNVILPQIAKAMQRPGTPIGGWLEGLAEDMGRCRQVRLTVCFPLYGVPEPVKGQAKLWSGEADAAAREAGSPPAITYYGFSADLKKLDCYDPVQERQFRQIMEETKPDLLHIFGTEYPHSLAAARAFGKPERTMIHIQGLVSVYALHFMADLPYKVRRQYTFRDLLRRTNLEKQQKSFVKRGVLEKKAIRSCGHILGRTDWDRACTGQINPKAVYHVNEETLRRAFYREENRWSYESCEKYSIFLSQGSYPIKGLHYMLEAMPLIRRRYPKVRLYVAGEDISKDHGLKDRLRQSAYGRYICRLLDRYGLRRSVEFTGFLDEERMCRRYRASHVFVCPSSVENSPNSVGEAMALGMPVVSADMGGVKTMLTHEREGLIYPVSAPYMLAYDVCRIFADPVLAKEMGVRAREKAMRTHDREKNTRQVLELYEELAKGPADRPPAEDAVRK